MHLIIHTPSVNFRNDWKYAYWAIVAPHQIDLVFLKTGVTFAFFNSEGKRELNKKLLKLL